MASIVSTSIYIDKYQYCTLGCSRKSEQGDAVNRDTNLAAWMIGGGRRTIDPSETRDLAHSRALDAGHCPRRGLIARLAAGATSILRPAFTPLEPCCCPA
jgi:hypothetical protein